MLDLLSAFDDFAPDFEERDPAVDSDFITDFLHPYFHDLPREALAAKVAEVIAVEQCRRDSSLRAR